jgi:glycosyltransferase involved in cell wall biosynthesis
MRKALILIHPSTGLGDAVPTVIKEAMALGTVIVASDVAGIPELVDHGRCGVLVPPRSPSAIAEAVRILLGDDNRRTALAHSARRFCEATFDIARNSRVLIERLRLTRDASTADGIEEATDGPDH